MVLKLRLGRAKEKESEELGNTLISDEPRDY
jgi:hypothetical protein